MGTDRRLVWAPSIPWQWEVGGHKVVGKGQLEDLEVTLYCPSELLSFRWRVRNAGGNLMGVSPGREKGHRALGPLVELHSSY